MPRFCHALSLKLYFAPNRIGKVEYKGGEDEKVGRSEVSLVNDTRFRNSPEGRISGIFRPQVRAASQGGAAIGHHGRSGISGGISRITQMTL